MTKYSPHDITLEVTAGTLFKSGKALVLQMGSYGLLPYSDKEQAQVAGNFKLYEIPTIKKEINLKLNTWFRKCNIFKL
ncbi:hypothetical protein Q5M85_20620 [Paraclostridium bifermentans]|nr:hypothetical protein [Paraclostridium bifermentans]